MIAVRPAGAEIALRLESSRQQGVVFMTGVLGWYERIDLPWTLSVKQLDQAAYFWHIGTLSLDASVILECCSAS